MRVSTYKEMITPYGEYFPCYLSGHAIREECADGILDDLWVTVLVLRDNSQTLIWITIDLIGLNKEWTTKLKNDLSEKYNVPFENINVGFIHTHSAPEYDEVNYFGGPGAINGYIDFVYIQTVDAVGEALNQEFVEVQAFSKKIEVKGCYGNRNGIDQPADKIFQTVEFRSNQQVIAGFFVISCHSTVLGPRNLKISSDLAGHIAIELKKRWGVYPVTMIGSAGDMSNRLYRQGDDINELNRIVNEIMNQYDKNSVYINLNINPLKIYTWRFNEIYYPKKLIKQKQYEEILYRMENAKSYDEKKVYTSSLAVAKRGLRGEPFNLDLECSYIYMGDIRIFTIPAELFARFGLEIKKRINCKCPIVWGYCNYSAGYLGNKENYGDSFETASSDIPIGTTERIVSDIIKFIDEKNEENI